MTTIREIKENLNIAELSKSEAYEDCDCTNEQIMNWETAIIIERMIQNNSKRNAYRVSATITNISFDILNEEVINLLRELYKNTKNSFVKSVLETVGKTKKYSEKQIEIITNEMIKFDNLIINL